MGVQTRTESIVSWMHVKEEYRDTYKVPSSFGAVLELITAGENHEDLVLLLISHDCGGLR